MTRLATTARTLIPKVARQMVPKKSFSTESEIESLRREIRNLKDQIWELHKKIYNSSIENINNNSGIRLEMINQNSETRKELFDRIYKIQSDSWENDNNLPIYGAAFATCILIGGMYLNFKIETNARNIRFSNKQD